ALSLHDALPISALDHQNACHVWNRGPASIAIAIPHGMKQLQSENAMSRRAPVVRRSSIAGPATMISTKPSPSRSRDASRIGYEGATAPAAPASAITPSPSSNVLRPPMAAAATPAGAPPRS